MDNIRDVADSNTAGDQRLSGLPRPPQALRSPTRPAKL
jgi:hypothetical protein